MPGIASRNYMIDGVEVRMQLRDDDFKFRNPRFGDNELHEVKINISVEVPGQELTDNERDLLINFYCQERSF